MCIWDIDGLEDINAGRLIEDQMPIGPALYIRKTKERLMGDEQDLPLARHGLRHVLDDILDDILRRAAMYRPNREARSQLADFSGYSIVDEQLARLDE